jgi:hypothetical protein
VVQNLKQLRHQIDDVHGHVLDPNREEDAKAIGAMLWDE